MRAQTGSWLRQPEPSLFHVSGRGGYHAGQGKDSLRALRQVLIHHKLLGESVELDVSRPRMIGERERGIATAEKQGPLGLARVQCFS